jgi:hypothetical protein
MTVGRGIELEESTLRDVEPKDDLSDGVPERTLPALAAAIDKQFGFAHSMNLLKKVPWNGTLTLGDRRKVPCSYLGCVLSSSP